MDPFRPATPEEAAYVAKWEQHVTRAMQEALQQTLMEQPDNPVAHLASLLAISGATTHSVHESDEKTEAANQTPANQTPAAGVSPAVVATTSSAVGPTEWTVAGWLGSTGGAIDALAYSLSSGRATWIDSYV